jgi:putative transposase
MKLLKQRFSIWFNRSHERFGTLWAERFKSVLVEPKRNALRTMAAYIDLNAVRAGLVEDPKDYRFCGYAEAVAGNRLSQRSLAWAIGQTSWPTGQAAYRLVLFGSGARGREDCQAISAERFQEVVKQKGHLPLASVLRTRIRYFSDGAVLGSKAFVELYLARLRRKGTRTSPRLLPSVTDWGELATLRALRKR